METYYQKLTNKLALIVAGLYHPFHQPNPWYFIYEDKQRIFSEGTLEDFKIMLESKKLKGTLIVSSIFPILKEMSNMSSKGLSLILTSHHDQNILASVDKPFSGVIEFYDHDLMDDLYAKQSWFSNHQRPWITLSFGMSLDGKIATYTGDSKYITGPEGRQFVHQLRHSHDAILVGIQTVLADDPILNTRLEGMEGKNPIRIVLDSHLKITLEATLVNQHPERTILVTKAQVNKDKLNVLKARGVLIIIDQTLDTHINLPDLMKQLLKLNITSILVEGGGTIHFSFIKNQLFNHMYTQISPMIIGGKDATTPVEGEGFDTLKNATRIAYLKQWTIGSDIIIKSGFIE
jgi:riboflavin-specific deaminase-like protein